MPKGYSYNYAVVVYDDSDTLCFDSVFDDIRGIADKWCYIYHDADGVKEHYHVLFKTHNQRGLKSVMKDLGIDHGLEAINSYEAYQKYMLHGDKESAEAGKHVYPDAALVRSSEDDKTFQRKSKEEKELENALNYFTAISDGKIHCANDLWKYAISTGTWGFLRQNYGIIRDLYRELDYDSIARFRNQCDALEGTYD